MKTKLILLFSCFLFFSCNKDVVVDDTRLNQTTNTNSSNTGSTSGSSNTGSSNTGSTSGSSNTGSTSGSSNTGSTSGSSNTGSSNTGSTSGSSFPNINNDLYTIFKISNKIYIGGDGILLYSEDNGITFNIVVETDLRILNLYFENENQGVLAGTNGGYSLGYKTSNGGVTWEGIFQSGYDPYGSQFTSGIYSSNGQEKIIILTNDGSSGQFGQIYFSENGGIDWGNGSLSYYSGRSASGSSKSFLLNGDLYIAGGGYLGGSNGTSFFYSSFFQDNSTNLIENRLGLRIDIADLFFTSNYGYIVGRSWLDEESYGISSDSGNNWTFKTIPGYGEGDFVYFTSVYFITDEIGFISTSKGDLLKTTNLGLTWTLIYEGDGTRINDIEQISSNQLLMVGQDGMIEIFEF